MEIFRRYHFYKRLLQASFVVNGVFVGLGIVAAIKYFRTESLDALNLSIVAVGALIFGILIPWFLFERHLALTAEMRKRTEEAVARWIAKWVENFDSSDDVLHDPMFWINTILMTVEVFGGDIKHPAAKILSEFAPLMKQELKKNSPRKKTRRGA